MKRLIVNADDFGLHTKVNHGIIEGYQNGCIRSTSFIAAGEAAEEAASLARENPGLGVGAHLTLVAERPVLPPDQVRSLVDADGRLFADHGVFIKHFISGQIRLDELYAECDAQITKAESMGVQLSHIDSHQHLHVLPKVIDICIALAKKHGIYKMRLPAEDCMFTGGYPAPIARHIAKCGLTTCARMAKSKLLQAHIAVPHAFFGMLAGGHMYEKYFLPILHALPEGVSEIMVHPGVDNLVLDNIYHWNYHWEEELASVKSTKAMTYIKENHVRLISFKELADE